VAPASGTPLPVRLPRCCARDSRKFFESSSCPQGLGCGNLYKLSCHCTRNGRQALFLPCFKARRVGEFLPLVVVVYAARIACLDVARVSQGPRPAAAAVMPVAANPAVVAPVFAVRQGVKERIIPNIMEALLANVADLDARDVYTQGVMKPFGWMAQ